MRKLINVSSLFPVFFFFLINRNLFSVNQRHKETVRHLRTTKDMLVNCYRETMELRKEIQTLKEVPANRTFPLKSQDSVNKTTEIFADPKQCGNLKREIAYTLGNTTDDDWLRAFIKDDVVFLYQRADTLRHLNFIRYIIGKFVLITRLLFLNFHFL